MIGSAAEDFRYSLKRTTSMSVCQKWRQFHFIYWSRVRENCDNDLKLEEEWNSSYFAIFYFVTLATKENIDYTAYTLGDNISEAYALKMK